MSISLIIIIAIGLSMDSFAVAISNGLTIHKLDIKKILKISFYFSFFQAIMPLLGWFAGKELYKYIKDIDHWVAFGLLSIIGLKMIYEGIKAKDKNKTKDIKFITLIGQSVATSIDALAIGLSFAILNSPIIIPVIIIGLTTFGFSVFGLFIGKKLGRKFGRRLEIIGGLILTAIGIKILLEHTLMHQHF